MVKDSLATFIALFVLFVLLCLGILYPIWKLWCWVLPTIWDTGPAGFINPSYWVFVGMWALGSLFGNAIFNRGK